VVAYGDGVVAARARTGALEIHDIRYPCSAPAYLSYGLNPSRLRQYRELQLQRSVQVADNTPLLTVSDPLAPLRLRFTSDRYDLVVIASDGAAAVRDAHRQPVAVAGVLDALTRFRSCCGAFVQRRCRRFLAEHGWSLGDDLAVGAVLL
jgi:hypothetical protein